jgi:purine-binding chemotaxis protein CheW
MMTERVVIVVDVKEISIGLIVDMVSEVMSIPDTNIVLPPNISGSGSKYIKA